VAELGKVQRVGDSSLDASRAGVGLAPNFIGSFGVLIDNLGPWFGGLQWRDLGPYPVDDGEQDPRDKGYSEFNADRGYKVSSRLKV
jgi:hypothetical protein